MLINAVCIDLTNTLDTNTLTLLLQSPTPLSLNQEEKKKCSTDVTSKTKLAKLSEDIEVLPERSKSLSSL